VAQRLRGRFAGNSEPHLPTRRLGTCLLTLGRRVDVLQQAVHNSIASLPAVMLEKLLSKKLRDQGVNFPKTLPRKLAEHILSGATEPFRHAGRTQPKDISLTFDDADCEEITRAVDKFLNTQLPILVDDFAERIAKKTLRGLEKSWIEEQRLQKVDLAGFRERMEETWGRPLAQLRMLLTVAREWCGEAHVDAGDSEANGKSRLKSLMVRFLVRSCQVTDEIICLLENGFADGAMARWRTLHEIGVVAAVISKFGEDIAERYVAHQAVESRRAMKRYMDCCVDLGYRPVGAREVKRIEKRYDAAIAQYGDTFKSDYGWAAHHLKKARPTFVDLEAAAGHAMMRAHYQMGSDNVHAGIKSMYGRLGLMMDYDSLLAGRSNAGLTDPGQNAAHTLTQIALVVCLSPKLDDLVAGKIMQMLREEIPDSFWQADRRLRRKERAFRQTERQL
jgi:hypothetical protein